MKVLVIFVAACLAVAMAAPKEKAAMEFQKLESVNPDGSTRVFFWSTTASTFNEATIYCLNLGQELLVIKDHIKQQQIQSLIVANGLTQERWLWLQFRDNDYYWGDGTKAIYTNFYSPNTAPTYRGTILGAAGANQGKWAMKPDTAEFHFVCQPFE